MKAGDSRGSVEGIDEAVAHVFPHILAHGQASAIDDEAALFGTDGEDCREDGKSDVVQGAGGEGNLSEITEHVNTRSPLRDSLC